MTANEHQKLEYAGFWIRIWASIIDSVLFLMITIPLLLAIYGEQLFESEDSIIGPMHFLISYVAPALGVIMFWIYKSATPGKMVISAKIVDEKTGNKPSNGQFVGRYFAYIISALPLGLGIFWIAFDKKKQGWHDKLAGTVVIRKKNTGPEAVAFEDNT